MRTLKLILGAALLLGATACTYYDDTAYPHRTYAYTSDYPVYHRHYYAYSSYPDSYTYYRPAP